MKKHLEIYFNRELKEDLNLKDILIPPLEAKRDNLVSQIAQISCPNRDFLSGQLSQVLVMLREYYSFYEDKPEGPSKE